MKFYVRDYAAHAYPCPHLPKIVMLYSSRFQNMLLHKASTVSSRLMRWWYFLLRRKNKRFLADVIAQVWLVKPLIAQARAPCPSPIPGSETPKNRTK